MVSGLPNITPIFSRIWLMKMTVHLALGNGAGELAQRLAHEPGLQADVAVAHFALDFGPRNQGGHRVDDDHVHRVGADEQLADFQGLLAGIGLADQQIIKLERPAAWPRTDRARARRR